MIECISAEIVYRGWRSFKSRGLLPSRGRSTGEIFSPSRYINGTCVSDQRPAIYETRIPLSLFPRLSGSGWDTPVDKTVTISIISLILRLIGRACNFLTIPLGLCNLVNEVTCVSTNARLFFCSSAFVLYNVFRLSSPLRAVF